MGRRVPPVLPLSSLAQGHPDALFLLSPQHAGHFCRAAAPEQGKRSSALRHSSPILSGTCQQRPFLPTGQFKSDFVFLLVDTHTQFFCNFCIIYFRFGERLSSD